MSTLPTASAHDSIKALLVDADRCVKCGLCLPHCPTYRLSADEGDSPRGRIALMQGLVTGQIGMNGRLEAHLDGCLACRACEPVCPATVPYGRLIDAGRAEMGRRKPSRARLARVLGAMLARVRLRRTLGWLLWLYQTVGLQQLLRRLQLLGRGDLARLESLLPPLLRPAGWASTYPAFGACQGQVSLFIGCVSELAEQQVLRDGITLLTRLGYEVKIPPSQTCCGALHLHNGLSHQARGLAEQNTNAFAGDDNTIVGTASGCTATLYEYDELLPSSTGAGLENRVQDICSFLAQARGWERVRFRPLAQSVDVHEPCTLRNVLKSESSVYDLLEKIPQLQVRPLAGNAQCCGAAGSYFLTQPGNADRLVADKMQAITASAPDWVISSNVGCTLHLEAALRRAGKSQPVVVHPVSLLARQLEPGPAWKPEARRSVAA